MLVQCGSCQTTYRVAESLIAAPSVTFRCSRCKHIFLYGSKAEGAEKVQTPPVPAAESPAKAEPDLPFHAEESPRPEEPSVEPPSSLPEEPEAPPPPVVESETLVSESPRQEKKPRFKLEETWNVETSVVDPFTMTPEEPEEEETRTATPAPAQDRDWSLVFPPPEEPVASPVVEEKPVESDLDTAKIIAQFEEDWRAVPSEPDAAAGGGPADESEKETEEMDEPTDITARFDATEDRPLSVLPYLSLCLVLLALSGLVFLAHQARPGAVEAALKTVPGSASVFRNNHLRQGVALQSLRATGGKVLGNREAFLVSGVAVNRNPVAVREVRVEAQLFGDAGQELARQAIWVGNAVSSSILSDLTQQEISILQKLSPQKRFEIPPEGSASFVVVFVRPIQDVKNFGCRVLSAEGTI